MALRAAVQQMHIRNPAFVQLLCQRGAGGLFMSQVTRPRSTPRPREACAVGWMTGSGDDVTFPQHWPRKTEGYVPLAEVGAEFLFQVIAERAERTAVILTTNLAFSEWTQVIPNARLCKALLDRITDRAHILETGKDSYRFRRTLDKRKKGEKAPEES